MSEPTKLHFAKEFAMWLTDHDKSTVDKLYDESNGRTDGELHETRTEAESAAFTRAFQLREQITTT